MVDAVVVVVFVAAIVLVVGVVVAGVVVIAGVILVVRVATSAGALEADTFSVSVTSGPNSKPETNAFPTMTRTGASVVVVGPALGSKVVVETKTGPCVDVLLIMLDTPARSSISDVLGASVVDVVVEDSHDCRPPTSRASVVLVVVIVVVVVVAVVVVVVVEVKTPCTPILST